MTSVRVNRVQVELDVYVPFEGVRLIRFEYEPQEDDPLVNIALAKHRELLDAEIAANPPRGPEFS